jgi:large subunit ribosomal protein L32
MRATRGHSGNRRSHHALTSPRLTLDKETGVVHERHRVSEETGMYRGRKVIDVEKREARNQSRAEAKAKSRGLDPEAETKG